MAIAGMAKGSQVAKRRAGERHDGDADSLAHEFQRQPGNDERCEKERQEPLSGAAEGDDLALGGVEGLRAARVSAIADLQGMTSRLDWYLDRVIHFDRPVPLTIDHDIVRATTDLRSDCLMRHLQRCRYLLISSCFSTTLLWVLGDERNVPATGVAPTTPLATQAGVTLGVGGALLVTRKMATNRPDVCAAGDCTVIHHLLLPPPTYLPLGTTAHK